MQKLIFIFFTAAFIILPVFWSKQINFTNTVIVKNYLTQPLHGDNNLQSKSATIALNKPDSSTLVNSASHTINGIAKLKPQLKLSFDIFKEKKVDTLPKKTSKPVIPLNTYAHL